MQAQAGIVRGVLIVMALVMMMMMMMFDHDDYE